MMSETKTTMSRTSYDLTRDEAERLREIAGDLGFMQSRGAGAGVIPSVTALLRALGRADRDATVAALRALGVSSETA
jgi:hypothetical protein